MEAYSREHSYRYRMMYSGEMELSPLEGYDMFVDEIFESPHDLYEDSI